VSRPTPFVVLTTQRSGSSWLIDLLNEHPAVVAYPELFRVGETAVYEYGASDVPLFEVMVQPGIWSVSRRLVRWRYRYVRSVYRAHPHAQAVGFKLMYDHTRDHPGLMSILALARVRVVHLVRRGHLGALVSFDLAEQRRRWFYREGEEIAPSRVRVEPQELLRRLEEREGEIERFRRRLARRPVPVLEVTYEDLLEQRDEVLRSVLGFLGVAPADTALKSSLVRVSRPEQLASRIENYEEIRSALAGTRFASLAEPS
jgi:LPS sulfotransferase NodH